MARIEYALIALALATTGALAQTPEPAAAPLRRKQAARAAANSPELENVRKALEALTPEQRLRFKENFLRWSNLSPDEKKSLRDRDELRRKRMTDDIDRAVKESGLTLDSTQRENFARRYTQERGRIEEQLRKETEEKRRPLLRELVAKLKGEFDVGTSTAAAAIAPAQAP